MGAPGWWEAKHLALAAFAAAFLYDLAPMWGSVAIRSEMAEIQDCASLLPTDGQPLGSTSSNLAGVLLVTPKSPPGGLDGYLKRKEAR